MENPKPLATESFSYSWLVDRKPNSSENSTEKGQNFNFDVPFTACHVAFVHADEIFSDGHIMPVYVDRSKVKALKTSTSVPPSPVSPYSLGHRSVDDKNRCILLGKWRRSSKRIVQKCFELVKPLYRTIGCSRKSIRVDDLELKVCEVRSRSNSLEASPRPSSDSVFDSFHVKKVSYKSALYDGVRKVKSWSSSPQASPRISPTRSSNAWCDVESSIHEAILYCKRSIEK